MSTLPPWENATLLVNSDGTGIHFQFGIPQGIDGAAGEVTNHALATAIGGTSANTNAVATLPSVRR